MSIIKLMLKQNESLFKEIELPSSGNGNIFDFEFVGGGAFRAICVFLQRSFQTKHVYVPSHTGIHFHI